jgi:hypothetical protein
MIKKVFIFIFFLMSFFQIMSQNDSIQKTNPIIYFEASAGVARLNSDISTNVNFTGIYQKNKDLLTFRFSESSVINGRLIIFFPIVVQETINSEFAFLYGRRWLQDNSSTSLSIGVSYNDFKDEFDLNIDSYSINSNHIGLPFEANIKWFKSRKKRIRIYGLVPVGKPTSLGGAFGFKLSGNISSKSYVSLGLVYSFGFHKQY